MHHPHLPKRLSGRVHSWRSLSPRAGQVADSSKEIEKDVSETPPEDDDYDLQLAWDQVCQSFAQTTRKDIRSKSLLTPEDIILQLKYLREEDAEKSAKHRVLKDILGNSLKCIQNLGGIVAMGASMAFGPTNVCFNAISYLITAGQNYRNIFSSLTELFKQVSDILERFVVYRKMKEIDLPLRKIIHELLRSLVSICELSVKVLRENKVVKFLKVFAFSQDGGIEAEFVKLRNLVERESQMKTTHIYQITKEGFTQSVEAVSGVQSVVDKIADSMKKTRADSDESKQLEKIKNKLGSQEQAGQQAQLHSRFLSERVKETGQWLSEEPSYIAWSNRSAMYSRLLFVSGNEGYGKSFLVTNIIHDLQKRYNKQMAETSLRTNIAYYYFQPSDSKTDDDFDRSSVYNVLKALALQLAQDPVYRKSLTAVCDGWVEPESVEELFIKLFDACYQSNEAFYLILDGLDQINERQIKAMVRLLKSIFSRYSTDQQSHVRILLSGRVQVLQNFTAELGTHVAEIEVALKNRKDIEKYVRDRLGSMKLLQGDSVQIQALREDIFLELSEGAHGDFINVDLILKEIGTKQWPSEIREVLLNARSANQRSDTIDREIQRCNQSLAAQEIRDLSALLLWVICSEKPLTVKELKAVLYLQNEESSLQPLYKQIQDRYSAFFHLEDVDDDSESQQNATVSLVSDSIRDYFQDRTTKQAEVAVDSNRVQESEIKIIRRFLVSVCDADLFRKFGFDDFFDQKLVATSTTINVQLDNAPVSILLGCLKAIASSKTQEVQALLPYATTFFSSHLSNIDLSMTIPSQKVIIGKRLLAIFIDPELIAVWWTPSTIGIRDEWFYTDRNVDAVLSWFKDSAVIKSFSEKDKEWVKNLTSNTSVDKDLLMHVAVFLAKDMFNSYLGDLKAPFSCIHAFRTKIQSRKNPKIARSTADATEKVTSAELIYEISEWTADQLEVKRLDYEWTRRLGRLLRDFSHLEDSVNTFKQAIALTEDHWFAEYGLATTYSAQRNWQATIEILEGVLKQINSGEAKDPAPTDYLREIWIMLARSYRDLGTFEKAFEAYNKQLETDSGDYETVVEKIQLLRSREKDLEIINMLQHLQKEVDPYFGINRLSRLYHVFAFDDDYHTTIITAGKQTKSLGIVYSAYRKAIEDTAEPTYLSTSDMKPMYRVFLTYMYSRTLYDNAATEEEKQEAFDLLEDCTADTLDVPSSLSLFIRHLAGKHLSKLYIEKIREAPPESSKTKELLQKLSQLAINSSEEESFWYESSINTNLVLGRYYSTVGQEKEAMDCIRRDISVGIDLLSDESPENDWQGYTRLANGLMHFGDDDNALAAWSLICPYSNGNNSQLGDMNEDKKQSEDHTDDNFEDQLNTDLQFICDGCHEEILLSSSDMYICKDCLDVGFDKTCIERMRKNELGLNVCNPKHAFLHVPKWDEVEAKERGTDQVRLAGQNVPVKEWLEDLRQRWGLKPKSSSS